MACSSEVNGPDSTTSVDRAPARATGTSSHRVSEGAQPTPLVAPVAGFLVLWLFSHDSERTKKPESRTLGPPRRGACSTLPTAGHDIPRLLCNEADPYSQEPDVLGKGDP